MPKMDEYPVAATLKHVFGLEETSPSVERTAVMLTDDLIAALGGTAVFGPIGTSHSTGLVPDPGAEPVAGVTAVTLSPYRKESELTLSLSNMKATCPNANSYRVVYSTGTHLGSGSVKVLFELTINSTTGNVHVGIANTQHRPEFYIGIDDHSLGFFSGNVWRNATNLGVGPTFQTGDILQVAYRADVDRVWMRRYRAGVPTTWNAGGGADPATNVGGYDVSQLGTGPIAAAVGFSDTNEAATSNFGATTFTGAAVSGFSDWEPADDITYDTEPARLILDDATWTDAELADSTKLRRALWRVPQGSGYGGRVLDLEDMGIVPDYLIAPGALNPSPTDNADRLQDILNHAMHHDTYLFPAGFVMLGHDVICPQSLVGLHFDARNGYANVVKDYDGSTTTTDQFCMLHLPPTQTRVENLWLWAAAGTVGGNLMGYAGNDNTSAPEEWRIHNIVFSNFGGTVNGCLIIEGTDGPNLYGSRSCIVTNCIFHAGYTGFGIRFGGTNSARILGCDFINDGFVAVADLWQTGAATNRSNDTIISASSIDAISLDYCGACHITAGAIGDISITANTLSTKIDTGFIAGSVINNGVATRIETPLYSGLVNASNDVNAAANGVEVGEVYRNGSVLMVRVS